MAGMTNRGWGIVPLRLMVGAVFVMHGGQKLMGGFQNFGNTLSHLGIPAPLVAAVIVTVVEFFGGIALILGLFSRWAAVLLAIDMLVAVLKVHLRGGFFLPRGFEYALTLLTANIALAVLGPGAAALDSVLRRRST
jgi:putative oxidoreductase